MGSACMSRLWKLQEGTLAMMMQVRSAEQPLTRSRHELWGLPKTFRTGRIASFILGRLAKALDCMRLAETRHVR